MDLGHRQALALVLDGVDRGAGGDAAQDRQLAGVVGGDLRLGGGRRLTAALDHLGLEGAAPLGRRGRRGLLRQLDHLQRPGPVGQAADEAALLERRDQPVDARLGRQVQRLLHLVEGGGDAGLLDPFVDEHQQLVLLAREHVRPRQSSRNKPQTSAMFSRCSSLMSS
jgi:hypothetical protein